MTTPKNVQKLKKNQIFVFGSNLKGNHAGGAAKQALDSFGAINGQGEGIQGQSYAFPTLGNNMEKLPISDLRVSKELLYKCAEENKDKQFLVTEVGTGIAGFSVEEMKKVFSGVKPSNIVLPAGWAKIYGYKAFNKGLKCRDFQYEFGKDFYHGGEIKPCSSGFHFCKSLGEVYEYYSYGEDIEVCEIESEGEVIDEENKSVTDHIRIIRILNPIEASNNNGLNNVGHSNTGDRNTGNRNTGNWNTGNRNTGNRNTGDWNTGNRNTGDWNTGDWNTGYRNTGYSNTGDWNTGNRNTGNSNTGDWNTGNRNTGYFNFLTPDTILVFGKDCKYEDICNAKKPNCLYFSNKQWVDYSDMTEKEKKYFPSAKTCGGYLKEIPYKEAFTKSMKKATSEEIAQVKELPNFDADIFEQISGFRIE